ncbi:MAG: phosphate ABC transporter permease subunit PstC [Pseudomonadota bacterium]
MVGYLLLALLVMMLIAYSVGASAANKFRQTTGTHVHSLSGYHGWYVAAATGLPALFFLIVWLLFQNTVIDALLLRSLPETTLSDTTNIELLIAEIKSVAAGNIFGEPTDVVRQAAARYNAWQSLAAWSLVVLVLAVALIGLLMARARLAPQFRARNSVEQIMTGLMIGCSLVAIFTTVGIVGSLLFETLLFFEKVSVTEFFTGLNWEPQIPIREGQITAGGAFGAIPVFVGTIVIAVIAMVVAVPIGLFAAIYLSEYASPSFRTVVKPVLEVLAGIPTIVYGFFAVLTVAPALRQFGVAIGFDIAPNSALAAGGVMGIMLIPFISSLSDDALSAVPQSLRDGSYGLGATHGETITRVLLPAALPGIMGGILLAASRAIGETMIVVMAAGIIAKLTANPFEPVTTVTVQIVTLLIGDVEFDNPKTLAAFALGFVLFICTLILNIIALRIVQKYREQYD